MPALNDSASAPAGGRRSRPARPRERLLLFVCSGNVCRSPMAEGLMREWLGPDSGWRVASAGVSALEDCPATPQAVEVLRPRGLDLSAHRSQQLTRELVDAADAIVVMTAAHRATIRQCFPEAAGRLFLLKSFDSTARDGDVLDPIGLSLETYRSVCEEINAALPDLVLFLREYRAKPGRS